MGVLLARDRRRGHLRAVAAGRVQREPAPARADLQQALARLQLQAPADAVELGELRLVQRGAGALEDRRRVHHRLVEEAREERVAEVVVRGDPLARAGAGVRPQPPRRLLPWCRQRQQPLAPAVERGHRARGDPHERDEVVAVPQAVHVGAAGAGAAGQQGRVEGGVVDLDASVERWGAGGRAEAARRAAFAQLDRAAARAAEQRVDGTTRGALAGAHAAGSGCGCQRAPLSRRRSA